MDEIWRVESQGDRNLSEREKLKRNLKKRPQEKAIRFGDRLNE